jgi:hypothetical protein
VRLTYDKFSARFFLPARLPSALTLMAQGATRGVIIFMSVRPSVRPSVRSALLRSAPLFLLAFVSSVRLL